MDHKMAILYTEYEQFQILWLALNSNTENELHF